MMPSRPEIMHQILTNQRRHGIVPMEIHANRQTIGDFAVEAKLEPVVPEDTRSLIERLLKPHSGPAPCFIFDGCRLVVNNRITGPALLIRPSLLMGDEDWLNKLQWAPKGPEGQQLIMPEGKETPWIQPAEQPIAGIEGSGQPEPEGALQALQQAGGISPTDVLIKAADGMDNVEHVLVVRYYKSGDVDLCTTFDRFGVHGALNKVIQYVMHRE